MSSDVSEVKANDVQQAIPMPTDEQLAALDSIGAIQDLMGPEVADASDLGSGFAVLENHDALIGRPCMFLFWNFYPGKYGDDFVAAHVVTFDGTDGKITGKYVINDGSTGIRDQLKSITATKNLLARRGLRKSEYKFCETCNRTLDKAEESTHVAENKGHKVIDAATYYIDTTAVA
jgi:hypothetical protein